MSKPKYLLVVLGVPALMGSPAGLAFGAAAGKGNVNQHGGKAAEQMSTKGALNTNAQWSADPDRGWIRADERHKLNQKADSSNKVKNSEQQKGKGKVKKS
jgi:hypothetical protein